MQNQDNRGLPCSRNHGAQRPVRATHEFSILGSSELRRTNSLEMISCELPKSPIHKRDKIQTHRRSSSLGTTELKEKLRRSLQREKNTVPVSRPMCVMDTKLISIGTQSNMREILQSHINPQVPVFGISRTRSLECLSELENLTLSRSPLTPHEGHKAPLPNHDLSACSTAVCNRGTQTPSDTDPSPVTYSPLLCFPDARSPPVESPDQYKIGSSPRVNCSFLFAQQPPATAAQAIGIKVAAGKERKETDSAAGSGGPDRSKIKIIFSSNSVFNRPVQSPFPTRHSPAEQTCK